MSTAFKNQASEESTDMASLQKFMLPFYKANPLQYWMDLGFTSTVSYSAFFIAALSNVSWISAIGFIVATLGFYRSIFFNHEVFHISQSVPGFSKAYNLIIGFWVKFPTYIYEPHKYHHTKNSYGTVHDSEWAEMRGKVYPILILPFIIGALTPIFLFVRFAVVPLFLPFIGSAGRKFIFQRFSTFAILPTYLRPTPTADDIKKMLLQDFGCFAYWAAFVGAIATNLLPMKTAYVWAGMACAIFILNHLRAMVAHTYDTDSKAVDFDQQLATSITVQGNALITELWAPLRISYHTLHHFFPKIPYHNLKAAHQELMKHLPEGHPYKKQMYSGFFPALRYMLTPFSK